MLAPYKKCMKEQGSTSGPHLRCGEGRGRQERESERGLRTEVSAAAPVGA